MSIQWNTIQQFKMYEQLIHATASKTCHMQKAISKSCILYDSIYIKFPKNANLQRQKANWWLQSAQNNNESSGK